MMQRPELNEIDLKIADMFKPGQIAITMSEGQWDYLLQEIYDNYGLLVELNDNEVPIHAFKKPS